MQVDGFEGRILDVSGLPVAIEIVENDFAVAKMLNIFLIFFY